VLIITNVSPNCILIQVAAKGKEDLFQIKEKTKKNSEVCIIRLAYVVVKNNFLRAQIYLHVHV
jgi:hypothetical protein